MTFDIKYLPTSTFTLISLPIHQIKNRKIIMQCGYLAVVPLGLQNEATDTVITHTGCAVQYQHSRQVTSL
jgi:hypothetical protein